jgi:hypothetical protein
VAGGRKKGHQKATGANGPWIALILFAQATSGLGSWFLEQLVRLGSPFDQSRLDPVRSLSDAVCSDHPQQGGVMPAGVARVGDDKQGPRRHGGIAARLENSGAEKGVRRRIGKQGGSWRRQRRPEEPQEGVRNGIGNDVCEGFRPGLAVAWAIGPAMLLDSVTKVRFAAVRAEGVRSRASRAASAAPSAAAPFRRGWQGSSWAMIVLSVSFLQCVAELLSGESGAEVSPAEKDTTRKRLSPPLPPPGLAPFPPAIAPRPDRRGERKLRRPHRDATRGGKTHKNVASRKRAS